MSKKIVYNHCGPAIKLKVFIIKANSGHYQYTEYIYPYKYGVYSYTKLLCCSSFTVQKTTILERRQFEFSNQVSTDIKIGLFHK